MQIQKTYVQKIINKGGGTKLFCYSLLSLSITNALAEEATLGTINVIDTPESIQNKKVGETVKTAKTLEKQQVSDTRDLVKYETGISVVEKGRMGASGYSVRGVDENRVNITIDGLQQAQTLSSQGFKELFEGYGNFNNTRNGIEVETVKQVNLAKGSDSTKVGSGALGGAVIFKTKDARDFLIGKDFYYKFKAGYASANNEDMFSHTLAGRYKDFDALLVRTDRDGTNFENFGYKHYPDIPELGSQGRARQKADPYTIEKGSTLLKLSYNPNENNRFTVMYDDYKNHSRGTDWSYTLAPIQTDRDKPEKETRHTNDSSTRRNIAFSFENYSETPLWDSLKVSVSKQRITQRAKTDEWCDGGERCEAVSNPLGLQLKDGKLYDKNGSELSLKEVPTLKDVLNTTTWEYEKKEVPLLTLVDAKGKEVPYPQLDNYGNKKRQADYWDSSNKKNDVWLNCDVQNCNSTLTFYRFEGSWGEYQFRKDDKHRAVVIDLNSNGRDIDEIKKAQFSWENDKKIKTRFNVEDIKRGGKHWKQVTVGETRWVKKGDSFLDKNFEGWASDQVNIDGKKIGYTTSQAFTFIKPDSPGYSTDMWTDRKLNTDSKQIKLDLEKFVDVKGIENQLAYGGMYSETDKSMVNRAGYKPTDIHWWAQYFENIDENGNPVCVNSGTCPYEGKPSSFLIPVKTKTGALYLTDKIRVNDKIGFDLSYRYDRIDHKPHFDPNKDPEIPKELLRDMYVQGPINKPQEPSKWSNKYYKPGTYDRLDNWEALFEKDKEQYKKDLDIYENNPQKNVEYLVKRNRKFTQRSYSLGTTLDPLDFMRVQLKYSKGFRSPASDELYFTFKHPYFSIIANPDLESEEARTKEIALTFHKDNSFIRFGAFRTNYTNFIELAFKGYKSFTDAKGNTSGIPYRTYQNRNNSEANVKGFSVEAKVYLADLLDKPNGFNFGYKFEYQKGKTLGIDTDGAGNEREIWHAINAIQPKKQIFSVGYVSPENNYGFDIFYTHASAKKKTATYNPYHGADQGIFEAPDEGIYAKHLSQSYDLFDVIGFYKPIKGLTLQAGIYNLFNKEYATWESIRSIRSFGTSNMICKNVASALGCNTANQGIERFSAPGRNFKLNVQYEF
ncbi:MULTISPECIES: TonB-dependent hemoglobin/transferrin/lactoferrin family receptor [Pasteurellaceae]|uniref:TonB-dependent hemoglobin/transferrin/lactoferrin family receptor n=1 Tax=Pasteurella atlantica TaxID=2827233 RepID=A0AAW8CSI3_9PAST|nr:TonB-dependent hemoglobin/transferrin/lactoferrin family receptor [Pasteurella atlantica]MBR0574489.1 TonB-dependent hemoglobin/transferrin/lactoferrin family receptor [Pasteurella atlantica]MDP8040372.1 TonB-dependent hemoglobin/transferrin/lactoferrin family receptor [Pasteurella atlantica]MDP8042423.1 TonB-dependent hemoglobin/transferrin/lactoferrin family receptor [Pasteurella atlantica]MDP8044642.1 TonB-dependent hemoglobin/transferrin/lactoferrin family receptor [Pasteurella atlantica